MPSDRRTARSITNRSTGGAPSARRRSVGLVLTINTMSAASRTSGTSATIQRRAVGRGAAAVSGITTRPHSFEQAHPPEFRELALMGVEHELAGIAEARLENRALPLTQHHGVGHLGGALGGTRPEHVEEHPVQVKAVD